MKSKVKDLLSMVSYATMGSVKVVMEGMNGGNGNGSLLFIPNGERNLRIVGANGAMEAAIESSDITMDSTGFVVDGNKLRSLLKNLDSDQEVELKTEGGQAILKAGRGRYKLSVLDQDLFPGNLVRQPGEALAITVNRDALLEGLTSIAHAMAVNDVRYFLNGVYFELVDGVVNLVATDGHRLAKACVSVEVDVSWNGIIPAPGAKMLIQFLKKADKDVNVTLYAERIEVQSGTASLTFRLIQGKYPDYRRVIPTDISKYVFVDREELVMAVHRCAIMIDEGAVPVVEISVGKDEMSIKTAANTRQNNGKEKVPVQKGEDLHFRVNPGLFLQALNSFDTEMVSIGQNDPASPLLIRSDQNGSLMNIVMPMR